MRSTQTLYCCKPWINENRQKNYYYLPLDPYRSVVSIAACSLTLPTDPTEHLLWRQQPSVWHPSRDQPAKRNSKKLIFVFKTTAHLWFTQRNCDSLVNSRQNLPNLRNISFFNRRPLTKVPNTFAASTTISVPRPQVNVSP